MTATAWRQEPARRGEEHAVDGCDHWTMGSPPYDAELVLGEDDLQFLDVTRPTAEHDALEDAAQHEVSECSSSTLARSMRTERAGGTNAPARRAIRYRPDHHRTWKEELERALETTGTICGPPFEPSRIVRHDRDLQRCRKQLTMLADWRSDVSR